MRNDNCIFCKIANGVIPSNTLYEDDLFKVILDLNPVTKGHALILPKNHFDDLLSIDEETGSKVLMVASKIATAMKKTLKCDGVNILQNNGEAAGQTVFHLHFHVIPRYVGDTVNLEWETGKPSDDDLKTIAEEIRAGI